MDTTQQIMPEFHPEVPRGIAKPPVRVRALTAAVADVIRVVACNPRPLGGVGDRHESDEVARKRGLLDIAIISTMRDSLLRRTEAAELQWKDLQFCEDGTGRLTIRRSKANQEARGFVAFLGPQTVEDLLAIRLGEVGPDNLVFNLTGHAINRRIHAAAKAAGQGEGFSAHSCRVGMVLDLARCGATTLEIMWVGRWMSAAMVVRHVRAEEAASRAVASGLPSRYTPHAVSSAGAPVVGVRPARENP